MGLLMTRSSSSSWMMSRGYVLGEDFGGFRFGDFDGDDVAGGNVVFGFGGEVVEEDVPGLQKGLDA